MDDSKFSYNTKMEKKEEEREREKNTGIDLSSIL
jgi:hypothetical protein